MKGGFTVIDSRSSLLVLCDLLQALPDSSGVFGSELVFKFTFVLKLGLFYCVLHLALGSPECLPAAADECLPAAADECLPAAADECLPAAADECLAAAADECLLATADECLPAAANECLPATADECRVFIRQFLIFISLVNVVYR